MSAASISAPAHIPPELVIDFDAYNPDGWEDDVLLAWKRMQDTTPPIFWTPRQGGHWVVTRGSDIRHIAENFVDFSSTENFIPRGVAAKQLPINVDPPEHTPVRRLIMPAFLPKQMKELDIKARATAIRLIEELAPRGACEFVSDFAGAMPIMVFLSMMGLPDTDYAKVSRLGDSVTRLDQPEIYAESRGEMATYLLRWIEHYRQNPGPGLISMIIHGDMDGRKLNPDEVENLSVLLLGAGLDTVKSMMSFAAEFMAGHPAHRKQLIDNPGLIPNAAEELARRFGTSNLARRVRHDMDYKGLRFVADEMVLLPFPLAGLDEYDNPDPMTVDFTRQPIRHTNFSAGPHTCPGAVLARREIAIFLEEWLKRIPDFHVKPGTKIKTITGLVNIVLELQLQWDPVKN